MVTWGQKCAPTVKDQVGVEEMKVLVTGSRVYNNYLKMREEIVDSKATILVHGDAKGADKLADLIGKQEGLDVRPYPAQWDRYGKGAGPVRNQQMLDEEHKADEPIDLVLAFPVAGCKGTWDMIGKAQKAGIKVKVIEGENERL